MSNPKVSVVIPTHNRPELLKRALESVYKQTFQDFEVIVVDDGDKPRAYDYISDFLQKENFTYLETIKNEGAPVARNIGIKNACAEFVAFLDDDDEWMPEKLEIQSNIFIQSPSEVGFIFCAVNNIYFDKTVSTRINSEKRDFSLLSLTYFKGFLTSGLVVRKEVLDRVLGFDESLPSHQEADLILRISQIYKGIGVSTPLVNMRMSDTNDHIGGDPYRRIKGREIVLEKHYKLFAKHPKILSKHYYWLAYMYRGVGDYCRYDKYLVLSLRSNFKVGTLIKLFFSKIFLFLKSIGKLSTTWLFRPVNVGRELRKRYLKKYLPEAIYKKQTLKIFDAGCGEGNNSQFLSKLFPTSEIDAVDINERPEWSEIKKKNISFATRDLRKLDIDSEYDLIVSIDVLEHIINNSIVARRLLKALKPEGFLYLAVPCSNNTVKIFPRRHFAEFYEWEKEEHVGEQPTLSEWVSFFENEKADVVLARHTFLFWGTFAWELNFILRKSKWGARINLLLSPIFRLLCLLDIYMPFGRGNNLLIIRRPKH